MKRGRLSLNKERKGETERKKGRESSEATVSGRLIVKLSLSVGKSA